MGALGWLAWWELLRDRQPPIEGHIDEAVLPELQLCARAVERPCRRVEDADRMVRSPRLAILAAEQTSGGNQGVIALALETSEGERFKAKWRSTASASLFSSPAKELAAYRLQALLLEPRDYVIPPVASHCFELGRYRDAVLETASPLQGTECVFGFLSYWLTEAITMPDARRAGLWPMPPDGVYDDDPQLYDSARFEADPVYRRNLAILNLITHLVNNRDAHAGQFVLYTEPWHAFLIDNSLAFETVPNPRTLFIQDLSQLIVPASPADVAARIRALERRDLDVLLAIEEYALDDGELSKVEPGAPFATMEHLRRTDDRLQIGLDDADVAGLWIRVQGVRRALEDGTLGTF